MSDKKPKQRTLGDELVTYGERSAYGLKNGAEEIGALARALLAHVPQPILDHSARMANDLPGAGAMESLRLGREAGGLYREGNYLDALDTFADAVDAPFKDVVWLIPGGGLVPKVMK